MKKLLPLMIILVTLMGCKKEKEEQPKDYFNEPVLDWTLDKQGVIAKEKRPLLSNHGPEVISWLDPMYESKGSGYLEFSSDTDVMNVVSYGFYCNAETLVRASCDFVNNSQIAEELTEFMINKYGKIYTESTSGSITTLTWEKSGVIINLYKGNYFLMVGYLKDPL